MPNQITNSAPVGAELFLFRNFLLEKNVFMVYAAAAAFPIGRINIRDQFRSIFARRQVTLAQRWAAMASKVG
jgi:hypothetical protein